MLVWTTAEQTHRAYLSGGSRFVRLESMSRLYESVATEAAKMHFSKAVSEGVFPSG